MRQTAPGEIPPGTAGHFEPGSIDLSVECYRITRRTGGAFHLERCPHKQKLVGFVSNQLTQVHVLEIPDATFSLQFDVTLEGLRTLATKTRSHRDHPPGVAASERNLALRKVLAG